MPVQQQWLPTSLSAFLWSEAAISDQSLPPQYLEDRVLFADGGLQQAAPEAHAQVPAEWLEVGLGSPKAGEGYGYWLPGC